METSPYIYICVTLVWLTKNMGYLKFVCCIHIFVSIFYICILYPIALTAKIFFDDGDQRRWFNWRSMALEWGGNSFVSKSTALDFSKMGGEEKLNEKDMFTSFHLIVIVIVIWKILELQLTNLWRFQSLLGES